MRTLYLLAALTALSAQSSPPVPEPGSRVLMDAHNCYPYDGRWTERIDRALSGGVPLAIEQDLFWYTDKKTGESRSTVSHGGHVQGDEPSMKVYFFEKIRPIVEQALQKGNPGNWPLITLNLDFKSNEPQHLAAVWQLLGEYESWLCTAPRGADITKMEPLDIKPVLVLTGDPDVQQQVFYDQLAPGSKLRVFGAAHVNEHDPMSAPNVLVPGPANNYRRWWNNAWNVVEKGGQTKAGDWTDLDETRLKTLVAWAHSNHYWIRFYTLDGAPDADFKVNGWFRNYSFGSRAAALERWKACKRAGVDYIASDHYEDLSAAIHGL